jgi:uncharacterized membrane protein YhaH (DUF805 family)
MHRIDPSLLQFLPILTWAILLFIPLIVLLRRTGKSLWWLLLNLIPLLGGIVLHHCVHALAKTAGRSIASVAGMSGASRMFPTCAN